MSKSTCTPRRKALAKRFKSGEFKKHSKGGNLEFIENLIVSYKNGGGLSRAKDFGSEKKPYPTISKGDFAGLHNRPDVKAKVYKKYPELKKHQNGGVIDFNISNILSTWKK